MPALTDTKPCEVLRGSKALTHGEPRAAGDTELLAAAQLIMPSHPLKAIVLWNRNQYPTHCYELSPGLGQRITGKARKGITHREQAQPRLILKYGVKGGSQEHKPFRFLLQGAWFVVPPHKGRCC